MNSHIEKNKRIQIRVILALLFLILAPLKYAVLSIAGSESLGRVMLIDTPCNNGKPIKPKPSIKVFFLVDKIEHETIGGGADTIPEFCGIHLGDLVKVTYFKLPKTNFMFATTGNPKEIFSTIFGCGIFLNIVGNLILALWVREKNVKHNP